MRTIIAAILTIATPELTTGQEAVVPQYEVNGDLKIPTGYERWVFVGSNLGLGYDPALPAMTEREARREEKGAFHNIYISPAAYENFVTTGSFPDPTILVMERYEAQDREPAGILTEGAFNGVRWEIRGGRQEH